MRQAGHIQTDHQGTNGFASVENRHRYLDLPLPTGLIKLDGALPVFPGHWYIVFRLSLVAPVGGFGEKTDFEAGGIGNKGLGDPFAFFRFKELADGVFFKASNEGIQCREGLPFVLGEISLAGRDRGIMSTDAFHYDRISGPCGADFELFVDLGLCFRGDTERGWQNLAEHPDDGYEWQASFHEI